MSIVVRHDSFPDQELHMVARYAKVESEGAEDHFFCQNIPNAGKNGANNGEDKVLPQELHRPGEKGDLREEPDGGRVKG